MSRFSEGAPWGLCGRCTSLAMATNNDFIDFPHIVSTSANVFFPRESLENAQNLGHFVGAETLGTALGVHCEGGFHRISIRMTR